MSHRRDGGGGGGEGGGLRSSAAAIAGMLLQHSLLQTDLSSRTLIWNRITFRSAMSSSQSQSVSDASSEASSFAADGWDWEVQEVLAERTSVTGGNELLVVWKTNWVPKHTVHTNGPIMKRFRDAPKCKFLSAAGDISVAVEHGTQLAKDVEHVQGQAQIARVRVGEVRWTAPIAASGAADEATVAAVRRDLTPRKQLNSVAKRRHSTGKQ